MGLGTFSGGGLGMGVAFSLKDNFSNVSRGIQKEMFNLEGIADHMTKKIDRGLTQVSIGAAAIGASLVTALPLVWGAKLAGSMEQTEIAFETMLKSATKARELIGELQTFADLTPFEPGPVIQSGRALLAYGFAAKDIRQELTNVGNVAAGLSIPLQELVDIYGKSKVEGIAHSKDIYQFTTRGIPLIQELAKQFGVADSEIMGMASDGLIRFEHIQTAIKNLSTGTGMFAGLMDKQSQSFFGLLSTAAGYLERIGIAIGKQLLPVLKPFAAFLGTLAQWVEKVVSSPLGGFIIKLVAGFTALLFVGGLVVASFGAMNMAAGFLAKGFISLNMTSVGVVFAQKGMIAGFRALAVSTWSALAPLLPYIAAAAAFGAIVYGAYKLVTGSIEAFTTAQNDMGKGLSTHIGWFQKLGGVLSGISEIWSSFDLDSGTFTLTDKLASTLESMGIKDTVLSIGTWIIRLKTFIIGIGEGIMFVWDMVKTGASKVWEAIKPGIAWLDKLGFHIGKTTSALWKWQMAGKILGIVIGSVFLALTVAAIAWGVSTLIAAAPILLIMGAIAIAVWGVYKVVLLVADALTWVADGVVRAWDSVGEFFSNMWSNAVGLKDAIVGWGANFINWIKEGISNNFSAFISWLVDKLRYIPGMGMLFDAWGIGSGDNKASDSSTSSGSSRLVPNTSNTDRYMNNTASLKSAGRQAPTIIDKSTVTAKTVNLQVNLDSRLMSEQMVDVANLENARAND